MKSQLDEEDFSSDIEYQKSLNFTQKNPSVYSGMKNRNSSMGEIETK